MHPDQRDVIPLRPEPISKQDGTDKNDWERHAAKRFIVKRRQDHPPLKRIVPTASLSSHAPHIPGLPDHPLPSIWGVQEGDHAYWFEPVEVAEPARRVPSDARDDAEPGRSHRWRFVSDVPRKASHADLRGNCLECWEWDQAKGQVHHWSWGPDLRVNTGTG